MSPANSSNNPDEITQHDAKNGSVYHGDCLEAMKTMDEDSVVLGFTSPPYFNAINYNGHVEKTQGETDRWEREDIPYAEYREFLMDRFEELYRITKPGGHTVVNIAPVHWEGERVPLPFHFVSWMEDLGWQFKEDIVWEKPVAKDRRSGVLLQHPYPGYYYPSVVSEYVFVFQKPAETDNKNNIYWNRSEEEKEQSEIDLDDYQGEKSKNVWKLRPVAPNEIEHPAPFPQELAERVTELYSYEGDTVVDIFGGSGQTYLAAQALNREFLGFETQEQYVDYSLDRVADEANQQRLDKVGE